MEACWAHNPEVRGSKPRSAMFSFVLLIFALRYLQAFFLRFCSTLFTIPKLSHQKELVPTQQQQSGAVEACWAHNPEVEGSKSRPVSFFLPILLYPLIYKTRDNKLEGTQFYNSPISYSQQPLITMTISPVYTAQTNPGSTWVKTNPG